MLEIVCFLNVSCCRSLSHRVHCQHQIMHSQHSVWEPGLEPDPNTPAVQALVETTSPCGGNQMVIGFTAWQ